MRFPVYDHRVPGEQATAPLPSPRPRDRPDSSQGVFALQRTAGNRAVRYLAKGADTPGPRVPFQMVQRQVELGRRVGRKVIDGASSAVQRLAPADLQTRGEVLLVQRQTPRSLLRDRPKSIPRSLLDESTDLKGMTDDVLRARHDDINAILGQFGACPADPADDYWVLSREAARAGSELARRSALESGRTFTAEEIAVAKAAFVANAAKPKGGGRKECIVILNHVLKQLWSAPDQKHTNVTMEKAMALFEAGGRGGTPREIWFTTSRGRRTRGAARPHGLQEAVWDVVVEMAAGDPGWSVFGMSIMDGFHAVTLSLDNTDPSQPKVYWSDQVPGWSDGWKEYGRDALNTRIVTMVQSWWDQMEVGRKHTTVVRLQRLRRTKQGQTRADAATP